jgi:phosphoglycerate kinase
LKNTLDFYTLDDFDVENKKVLLRVDFNLPLDKNTLDILDDTRIKRSLPTIKELLEKNAKVILMAHQGRPGGWDFTSLEKHTKALEKHLGKDVRFIDDIYGEKAKKAILELKPSEIIVLDNVRKYPGETEKKTAEEHAKSDLVKNLAPLIDIFVNDAFAAAHRPQCSLIGFTPVVPSCAGRLMELEIKTLEKLVKNPEKPAIFIFGGAKFSDTTVTIDRLLSNKVANEIILTGLAANAFLFAKGTDLGENNNKKILEEDGESIEKIKKLISRFAEKLILPVDLAIEKDNSREEIDIDLLPVKNNIYDIGSKTIELIKKAILDAKTIFLSGPCGVFENPNFMKGTQEIFRAIAKSSAFSIAGGGHTVAAIEKLGLTEDFSHVSTGGGSLERFLMGEKLPVIEALKESKRKFSNI